MTNETLSQRIRTLRTEKNLSQQQLADMLFVSRAAIANWESGNRTPDLGMLMRLSKIMGVEIYDLIDSKNEGSEPPTVIIVEDEPVILTGFIHILSETLPQAQIFGFQSGAEALDFARGNRISVAFLDIELLGENGVELAESLKDLYSRINIIFLTGHTEYTADALEIHCSGYILKPLTPEKIRKEIACLRFPVRGLSA